MNGAMLYDAERMQPLYRLSIGSPGSSFAVEVARRIGLPEDIIVDSSAKMGEDFINMDNFLQSIARDKLYWEDKRKEITAIEHKVIEARAIEAAGSLESSKDKAVNPVKKQSRLYIPLIVEGQPLTVVAMNRGGRCFGPMVIGANNGIANVENCSQSQ